jgi:hypothetical protein
VRWATAGESQEEQRGRRRGKTFDVEVGDELALLVVGIPASREVHGDGAEAFESDGAQTRPRTSHVAALHPFRQLSSHPAHFSLSWPRRRTPTWSLAAAAFSAATSSSSFWTEGMQCPPST